MKIYLFVMSCFFCFSLICAQELPFEVLRKQWEEYSTQKSGNFNDEASFFYWYQDLKKQGHFLADTPENRQRLQQELQFSELFVEKLLKLETKGDVSERLKLLEEQNQSLQKQLLSLQEQLQKIQAKESNPPVLQKKIEKNIKNSEKVLDLFHQKAIMIEPMIGKDEITKEEGQTYKIFRRSLQDGDKNFEIYIDASGEEGDKISEHLQKKINKLLQEKLRDGQAKIDLEVFQIQPEKKGTFSLSQKEHPKRIQVKGQMILEDRDGNKNIYRFDPAKKAKIEEFKTSEIKKIKKINEREEKPRKQIFIYGEPPKGPVFPPIYWEEEPHIFYFAPEEEHSLRWVEEEEEEDEDDCYCEDCFDSF